MNDGGTLTRAWRRYRAWPMWVQVFVALVAVSFAYAPFAPPEEAGTDTELAASSDGAEPADPVDELPRASTTTELATTTTEAPTTTSPPPTTAAPTTTPRVTAPPITAAPRYVAPSPPPTQAAPKAASGGGCHPEYGGCVPIDSDVDCAGGSGNGPAYVSGPVESHGSDPYDLDRDSDGVGCED